MTTNARPCRHAAPIPDHAAGRLAARSTTDGAPIPEAEDAEADESQHSSDPSVKYSIANCRKYRAIRRAGQLDPMGVLRFAKRRTRRLLLLREQ